MKLNAQLSIFPFDGREVKAAGARLSVHSRLLASALQIEKSLNAAVRRRSISTEFVGAVFFFFLPNLSNDSRSHFRRLSGFHGRSTTHLNISWVSIQLHFLICALKKKKKKNPAW